MVSIWCFIMVSWNRLSCLLLNKIWAYEDCQLLLIPASRVDLQDFNQTCPEGKVLSSWNGACSYIICLQYVFTIFRQQFILYIFCCCLQSIFVTLLFTIGASVIGASVIGASVIGASVISVYFLISGFQRSKSAKKRLFGTKRFLNAS